ncbi:hypothetical protein [Stenotrophomonas sp. SMYL11]|uniref:hypothetical protein n=1 Tax=Stenotrophomonas sp. SMYL11 TaxID=3076042 RepID=UPI002E793861|nr:hypothetical protein [Stenotrophomonas sp. SMYL11]
MKEIAVIAGQLGSVADGVIRWSVRDQLRRLVFITLLGAAFALMTWSTFAYLLQMSEQESKERLSLYLKSLKAQQLERAIDAVGQCIQSRKDASGDSMVNCGLAEVLYSNHRNLLVGDRYQTVMESKAYTAMLLDLQDMRRFHEARIDLDRPAGPHSELLSFLVGPIGFTCFIALILLAYGVALGRMLHWQARAEWLLFRKKSTDREEEDMLVGDMPNLPHERIHHPDRR